MFNMIIRRIFVVVFTTFRENYRNKFFGVLFLLSVVLIFFSLLLGELSFEEHQKILFDVGMSGIHMVMLIMTIFMGSFTLQKEFERQTYMTLLASPLQRGEFLIGKIMGLWFLIFLTLYGLGILLNSLLGPGINSVNFWLIFYGMLLEGMVLLSCAFLFALTLSPVVSLLSCFAVFLVGNWLDELEYFASRSDMPGYVDFAKIIRILIPNLQESNWRYFYLLEEGVPNARVAFVTGHLLVWSLFLFFMSYLMFKRKPLT